MKTMLVRERYKVVQVCGMETSGAEVSSMGTATFVQTMGNTGVEATETHKKSGVRTVKHIRNMWSGAVVVLLTVLCTALLCRSMILDCWSILCNGYGQRTYLTASVNGSMVSLLSQEGDRFRLLLATLDGKRTQKRTVELPVSATQCMQPELHVSPDGTAFLTVYEAAEGQSASYLALYRLPVQGTPERLLYEPCLGQTVSERLRSIYLSGITEREGKISFALVQGESATVYTGARTQGGLERQESQKMTYLADTAVLPDGTLIYGGTEWLMLDGRRSAFSVSGRIITYLTQTQAGLYYIDGISQNVMYCDETASQTIQVLNLSEQAELEGLTSLSIAEDGSVLLLRNSHTLEHVRRDGVTDLTGMLYRSRAASIGLLIALTVATIGIAALLWYVLCGRRHGFMPLAVRWGVLLALAAVGAGTVLSEFVVRPMVQSSFAREMQSTLASTSVLAVGQGGTSVQISTRMETALSIVGDGFYQAAKTHVYQKVQDEWQTVDARQSFPARCNARLSSGFADDLAEQALQAGVAFAEIDEQFCFCLNWEGKILQTTVPSQAIKQAVDEMCMRIYQRIWAALVLFWALAVSALVLVGRQLYRTGHAMERLSEGQTDVYLSMKTGDELEGLAASFNSMVRSMCKQVQHTEHMVQSYRRFVPERVLTLLGKSSVLEVDKHTTATRQMSIMMVWFTFPQPVYAGDTRTLFDSINAVIEHTAAIAVRKGGTVFNFAYNGYDVVLESDTRKLVSTAVAIQQQVLALNRQRQKSGLPEVTLRIALDVGEVILGIVGDETQMEQTTISASFTTTRHLIDLCNRLEAGILCTEQVIAGAEGYASRYMGKSTLDGNPLRVYEIFDGDPFAVRQSKEYTRERFAQGIFTLYSRDFAEAKRIFLELVHENPQDGGARYALYQADRLEKQPTQTIGLES